MEVLLSNRWFLFRFLDFFHCIIKISFHFLFIGLLAHTCLFFYFFFIIFQYF
jgi:hypothetical protein